MCHQRINSSNTMKNYRNTAEQKENYNSPETKPEVTEDYNLNQTEMLDMKNTINEIKNNVESVKNN